MSGVLAFVLAAVVCLPAQTSPSPSSPPPYLRVCSDKNPPPCATPPHPINSPPPEYSQEAREAKIEGTVVLRAIVGVDGHAHNIMVARTLGHGLDEQAIKTLKEWTFKPGTSQGASVPVLVNFQMDFHLTH